MSMFHEWKDCIEPCWGNDSIDPSQVKDHFGWTKHVTERCRCDCRLRAIPELGTTRRSWRSGTRA